MTKRKHVSRSHCRQAPAALMAALLGCVQSIGGAPDEILRAAGATFRFKDIADGQAIDIGVDIFARVNRACNALLREYIEATGQGRTLNEDQFRLMCQCIVGAPSLGDAIQMCSSFFSMFEGRIGEIQLETTGAKAVLKIAPYRAAFSEASFLIDVYGIAVLHMLFEWLTDQPLTLERADLTCPRARIGAFSLGLFDCPIRFGQATNSLHFQSACLERPVVRTSADLTKLLRTFPFDLMLGAQEQRPLSEHIYISMMNAHLHTRIMPTVDQVARQFGISSWTLRRRLAEEGSAYSSIRKKCQLNLATEFLSRADMTIDEIADIANFSDASAFRRAFQQWTGRSPSAYREAMLQAARAG